MKKAKTARKMHPTLRDHVKRKGIIRNLKRNMGGKGGDNNAKSSILLRLLYISHLHSI